MKATQTTLSSYNAACKGEANKDASNFYTAVADIHKNDLQRWLKKSETIQWDYKNIVKRKSVLVRLK